MNAHLRTGCPCSQAIEEQQKAAVEAAEAKQKAGLFRVELVPPLHIDQDV